jgi:hypothetical protein
VRQEIAFGPVIAWSKRGAETAPTSTGTKATPSGATAKATPGDASASAAAGTCFAGAVKQARADGLHLAAVEGGKGKLTLVYESAGSAKEITLAADPKTSTLLGCATLPRAAAHSPLQFRAEGAIDTELARGIPSGLKFGGPAGLADLVTIQFKDGKYVSLRPGSPDALVSASSNAPK